MVSNGLIVVLKVICDFSETWAEIEIDVVSSNYEIKFYTVEKETFLNFKALNRMRKVGRFSSGSLFFLYIIILKNATFLTLVILFSKIVYHHCKSKIILMWDDNKKKFMLAWYIKRKKKHFLS